MSKLVVVESPSKAKKIQKYLGAGWQVLASMGHVRDLPKRALGVDVGKAFEPKYEVVRGKGKVIARIRAAAKGAEAIYLATDPDREGEAIAWHVLRAVGGAASGKPIYRVTFNEITQRAVERAFAKPRELDMALVDSQQARRVLDRLVGWKLSPLLRHAFGTSLSAGRVQSVAVRLVTEREQEIEAFVPEQSWTLDALLERQRGDRERFTARLAALLAPEHKKVDPKKLPEALAKGLADALSAPGIDWRVIAVETSQKQRKAPPPFITSTMQQKASSKLGLAPKRAMKVAQTLYERGLITYMRTDSPAVAADARAAAREVISRLFGPDVLPAKPPYYRARGNAQEAHECIRPTDPAKLPKNTKLGGPEAALYRLIWMRFIASQMRPAIYDITVATIQPDQAGQTLPYQFEARGRVLREPGWLAVYGFNAGDADEEDDNEESEQALPPLERGEPLTLVELTPEEHWTKPPSRYSEPSLIKALEKAGVGRPSTYASIMETIQKRGYVERKGKSLRPTRAGREVTAYLTERFPSLLDLGFTREMESDLDRVAAGEVAWATLLEGFYWPLEQRIGEAKLAGPETSLAEPCPECGSPMEQKYGRYGRYEQCSECDFKPGGAQPVDRDCPECGRALLRRRSRYGYFVGCSGYPDCTFIEQKTGGEQSNGKVEPLDEASAAVVGTPCPDCGEPLVERRGKRGAFVGCSGFPKCRYIHRSGGKAKVSDQPVPGVGTPCPKCGTALVARQGRYGPFAACPRYPECKHIHRAG